MSIFTGTLGRSEGLLAVDTVAVAPFDTAIRMHTSKSYVVPHLGCVFATRGAVVFPANMLTTVVNTPLADFDALLGALESLAERAYQESAPYLNRHGLTHQVELMAMGWSAAEGRVVAAMLTNAPAGRPNVYGDHVADAPDFERIDVPDGFFMLPGIDAPAQAVLAAEWRRATMPRARIIAAAKAQRTFTDRQFPGFIGGRLILNTVTRNGVDVRVIYEWPDGLAMPTDAAEVAA
ncbi:MAG: hypothetical protein AB7P02_29445 [Alphaproteobacteria bacterium]